MCARVAVAEGLSGWWLHRRRTLSHTLYHCCLRSRAIRCENDNHNECTTIKCLRCSFYFVCPSLFLFLTSRWTSTLAGTSDTVASALASSATWRCSACGSSACRRPRQADSRRRAANTPCSSSRTACDRCRSCRRLRSSARWPRPSSLHDEDGVESVVEISQ